MNSDLRPSLLALSLAAALSGLSLSAQAASISLTATGNVNGSTPPGTNLLDPYPYPASGGDFLASPPPGSTGSLFFHTYGFTASPNYFGARVSGAGEFYGKTSASYNDSITNTTGSAQTIIFSFNVDSGQVELAGSGVGFADLLLSLRFNGSEVAGEHARVELDAGGASCVDSGGTGVLASYMSCDGGATGSSASGSGGTFNVSYLLGAGDTLTIDYDIVSEVSGSFTGGGSVYCAGGYGGEETAALLAVVAEEPVPGTSGCTFFNALSRSGDPAGAFVPANFVLAAAVPEPGSLALGALALGGLAAARRRRRDAAKVG